MGRGGLLAVAVVALGTGALLVGALTSPTPEAVSATSSTSTTTTTTTPLDRPVDFANFTVDQIATGEQLDWSRVEVVEDGGWRAHIVSQLGWLYLFTSSRALPTGELAGLRAFRSIDGSDWEDLGEVIGDDGIFTDVAATPFGLMAVESDVSDGSLTTWTSQDAVEWQPTLVRPGGEGHLALVAHALGASGSLVVVAANEFEDPSPLLKERLGEVARDIDPQTLRWAIHREGSRGSNVIVYGPLGIPALSIPISELDLTDEEQRLLEYGAPGNGESTAWSTTDGVNWTSSTIEGAAWISAITATPDGGLLAFGSSSNESPEAWRTYDGSAWETLPSRLGAAAVKRWRGQLAGLDRWSNPEVLLSSDGETWTELGLADYFPNRISWYPTEIATSDTGLAVIVQGQPPDGPSLPFDRPEPIVLVRNGFTLTIDLDAGELELEGGGFSGTWAVGDIGSTAPDDLDIDFVEQTVTFLDSQGDDLVAFSFDELDRAEEEYRRAAYPPENVSNALAYTGDGTSWSIQDLDKALGESVQVMEMAATPFRLVAVVVPTVDLYASPATADLQIWSAPLP
jgi:hypothetical protein